MNRIVILLGLGIAAIGGGTVFALSQKNQVSAQSVPASPAPAMKSQPATASPTSVAAAPISQSLRISGCNGSPAHANFREYSSFSPRSILGVVAIGESVNLTGRTTRVNGNLWYEAINPAPLHPPLILERKTACKQIKSVGLLGVLCRGSLTSLTLLTLQP